MLLPSNSSSSSSSSSSSNSSLRPLLVFCTSPQSLSVMESLLVAYVLLLPLFLYVVAVGYQRWRKDGFMAPFTTWSHIDIFTYNVVFLDLLNILGTFFYFLGAVTENPGLQLAGDGIFNIYFSGQTLFHLLTCMELYLAVVRPVFYLRLKGSAGVRVRNVAIGCVWLISILIMVLIVQRVISYFTINGLIVFFISVAFVFCSFSVLSALVRPGPGKRDNTRVRADQLKEKAFLTVIIITGTLSVRFVSILISSAIQRYVQVDLCLIGWSSMWFFVPSSLVLPLLLLQRAGKLPTCGANVK